MSHTKEPWAVSEEVFDNDGIHESVIRGLNGRATIAVTLDFGDNNPGMREANARRIVACINACAGIPIDMIEAMPNGPASLLPMYARLEKQRDELLAALEYVISDLELRASLKEDDERGEVDIGNGCYEQALAAIARNNRLPEGSPVD